MAFTRILGPGIHTASNINSHNIKSTGIITAVSFVGDGAGLTGIASTDNIITGTAATFNTYPVDINAGMTVSGVSTFSGNINLPDSVSAIFGTDDDGSIKHTGTNLQIFETTGNIQITNYANDKDVVISTDDGSGGTANYFVADGSTGKANLYYLSLIHI